MVPAIMEFLAEYLAIHAILSIIAALLDSARATGANTIISVARHELASNLQFLREWPETACTPQTKVFRRAEIAIRSSRRLCRLLERLYR